MMRILQNADDLPRIFQMLKSGNVDMNMNIKAKIGSNHLRRECFAASQLITSHPNEVSTAKFSKHRFLIALTLKPCPVGI